MHEMGIASSVLDAVRAESLRFPNGHVYKVGLRIGALAGVDPEAVSFCFDAVVRDSGLEPLALEIEYRARQHVCVACGQAFAAQDENTACPACGAGNALFVGGDELEIAYLEVEDGAAAARA
ncbi:MAG TPA: hydrogenase maturation nickel metallochaperone HypA [Candidatus Dormibacteraeota bacterium]|nr:hydrogenase maturation nickel metallochaperone HypA [Candidatus Dormibacteraeota bacterium]